MKKISFKMIQIFFFTKGENIKKWIEGQILHPENLDFYIKKLFTEPSKFHHKN
ncbi:hypothetical protein R7X45_02135 [Mesomycoplasma ovipneumoniae]|uniref:hypothetical protein n=1 Tax=Mesomycoplasma ovipneumoniae TaxID=29562 RepID=UPI0028A77D98|nr:hypothetical protein [Mesomycoplasma ovipneumoniae]MDW2926394.1 hypothetical protein [Mesomycoplasma ovipneumoniae]WNM16654.1 hypothetical protein RNM19_00745 [Mesomycoplasma ovipneumoniae]